MLSDAELQALMPAWQDVAPEQHARADTLQQRLTAVMPDIVRMEAQSPTAPIAADDWALVEPVVNDIAMLIFDLIGDRYAARVHHGTALRVFIGWYAIRRVSQQHARRTPHAA